MKIGIIGINSSMEESKVEQLKNSLGDHLYGIFSPHREEILPLSKRFDLDLFSSAHLLFENVDAIYFANSLKPNIEFAINALKNSCHLFIEDISELSLEEIKQFYKLAVEAQIKIHIKNAYLFAPEYLAANSSISLPQLIEINQEHNFFFRPKNYFYEIFNDVSLAITVANSGVKKISANAIPVDLNHFSLIYIRLDFDNGCQATIKYNNISKEKQNTATFYQSNQLIRIDFSNHHAYKLDIIHGQIITTDFKAETTSLIDIELKHFIQLINSENTSNISETPNELYMIQVTQNIMDKLYQLLNPTFQNNN
jgi:predicted dehydrogenase